MNISINRVLFVLCWAMLALSVSTLRISEQKKQIKSSDLLNSKTKQEINGEHNEQKLESTDNITYRLPRSLEPINYDLYLHPDLETGKFTGQESITIEVLEITSQIILHSSELTIENVFVTDQNDGNLEVEKFELETEREFLIIDMVEALLPNTTVNLGIIFSGDMKNTITGLYSSSYVTPSNEKRAIAASKFEPTYARRAFPCFDEPGMKATFDVVLVRPKEDGYLAHSNMDIKEEMEQGENVEVYFNRSLPMSTYLACFIISDFTYESETVNTNGIGENFEIRVYTRAYQLEQIKFSLYTAAAAMEFFIQYYQVEYPLPKLDMIGIPDYPSGAMEHWGLITFHETALLYHQNYSSTMDKQKVASTVAHELAHMWFGNLVTINWWNDLWLNEGFASYMHLKAVDKIYPDFGIVTQFLITDLHEAMELDSRTSSHPLLKTVEIPDQIIELFDTITYKKGAAIIRMLEDVVGTDKFSEGVINYLNKYKYQTTTTNDFITELENLGLGFDVRRFIRTWIEQMGLPVIEVRRTSELAVTVTQKRFFSNFEDYDKVFDDSEFNYTWTIPLTYFSDYDTSVVRGWFEYSVNSYGIPVKNYTKWLKFNVDQAGYYRVNYDNETWNAIIEDLIKNSAIFSIADRAQIIDDIFALADSSHISYDFPMYAIQYIKNEKDFVPWYVAVDKIRKLHSTLIHQESYADFLQFARDLLKDSYSAIDWDIEIYDHQDNRLRATIVEAACTLLPECLNEAGKRFENWFASPEELPTADLRATVYYYGMQDRGDEETWEAVWDILVAENDPNEKRRLMFGLAGIKTPWLLYRYIELASNETLVSRQDYFMCLQYIASNPIAQPILWEYYRENWEKMVERFGLNNLSLGNLIGTVTKNFDTETKLQEMEEFFVKYPNAGAGETARKQAIEKVKYNIQWLARNGAKVGEWLTQTM